MVELDPVKSRGEREKAAAVASAIRALPPDEPLWCTLHARGRTRKEIQQVTGWSLVKVWRVAGLARKHIRSTLYEYCSFEQGENGIDGYFL